MGNASLTRRYVVATFEPKTEAAAMRIAIGYNLNGWETTHVERLGDLDGGTSGYLLRLSKEIPPSIT